MQKTVPFIEYLVSLALSPLLVPREPWINLETLSSSFLNSDDTYLLPADFQPLEEDQLMDVVNKGGEDKRQLLNASPPWSLAGVDGKGDRPSPTNRPRCAYFSEHPPSEPMWLAIEGTQVSAPCTPSHHLFARICDSQIKSQNTSSPVRHNTGSSESTQKTLKARNNRRIRRLLRQMLCDLPLSATKRSASKVSSATNGANEAQVARRLKSGGGSKVASGLKAADFSRSASESKAATKSTGAFIWPSLHGSHTSISTHRTAATNTISGPGGSELRPNSATCSTAGVSCDYHTADIAVQAETLDVNSSSKSACCVECCRRGSQTRAEEWVGGARALRDSHVRLVVRQLRHIELLNRAIDGVSTDDEVSVIEADDVLSTKPTGVSPTL